MNFFGVRFLKEFVINNQAKEFSFVFPRFGTIEHIQLIGSSHFFLPMNRRYTVLLILSASLFADIQSQTFTNSALITIWMLTSQTK